MLYYIISMNKKESKVVTKRETNKKLVKKSAKSSVFTHIFSIPKYKRELYLCFHSKDKDIKEEEIKTWTLSSIFTNIQINDLGLLVRNTLLVLVEAQSVWTLNILPRMLEYLGESYNRYVIETNQNIYGTKKVNLPKPELYVLYTGNKVIKNKIISFKNEFFNNNCPIDIRVKVITLKESTKIVKEYIRFSKVLDDNNKKYGYTKMSINETIKYCIRHNILKDYLNEYKKEVYNIMTSVYDQKTATDMYGNERYAMGRAEGIQLGIEQGIEQGELEAFVKIYKKGMITAEEAGRMLNISVGHFLKLAK